MRDPVFSDAIWNQATGRAKGWSLERGKWGWENEITQYWRRASFEKSKVWFKSWWVRGKRS